jgi:hypothetical protein
VIDDIMITTTTGDMISTIRENIVISRAENIYPANYDCNEVCYMYVFVLVVCVIVRICMICVIVRLCM